jgi:glycosyltransferase involved in cell wall biosynthesis
VSSLVNRPGTPQHHTWEFLWESIKGADCFVSHPVRAFVPENVPAQKVVLMPATTDPLDGLNRPLTEEEMTHYLTLFNRFLFDDRQMPLDLHRPYIAQIARFDPAKGIPDAIESYRRLREMWQDNLALCPQLLLAGNPSVDDPDAPAVYHTARGLLQSSRYVHLAHDVKLGRLPPMDELLNTLLRKSTVALQLSIREGFEVKVTEALMKGKPVVAYRTGGIPLQIEDGVDGFLVDVGDTAHVAHHLSELLTDTDLYRRISNAAAYLHNNTDFLTVSNAICWLFLALWLLEKGEIEGYYQDVKTLASHSSTTQQTFQEKHAGSHVMRSKGQWRSR